MASNGGPLMGMQNKYNTDNGYTNVKWHEYWRHHFIFSRLSVTGEDLIFISKATKPTSHRIYGVSIPKKMFKIKLNEMK